MVFRCSLPVALPLVIIHHFHIICVSIFPSKAYAPLHVNGDAELTVPISLQLFQPGALMNSERIELTGCMQNTQHAQPLSLCGIQRLEIARGKRLFRPFIFAAHNHLKPPLMNASSKQPEHFCGIRCANTLNVFVKHKSARFACCQY